MSLLLGIMGLGGRLTSSGIYNNVLRLGKQYGWQSDTYTHAAKVKPVELLRQNQGKPIIVVANSLGVDAADDILTEHPDLKIDVLFAVVSAMPETIPSQVGKVVLVTASGDIFRNFTIKHPNIETLHLKTGHLGADDHPDLWEAVEWEMVLLSEVKQVSQPQDYFNRIYSAARDLGASHVLASIAAAQSAIETGWGRYLKGNSYFGVKAGRSWQGQRVSFTTHEVERGQRVRITDSFRSYESLEDAVRDYLAVMRGGFPNVYGATTLKEGSEALGHGKYGRYATNPDYEEDVYDTASKRADDAKSAYSKMPEQAAPTLRRGDRGVNVDILLQTLAKWGYYDGVQDAVFGGGAEAAVRHFQHDAKIQIDGIVGKESWAKLETWNQQASAKRPQVVVPGVHYVNQNAIRNQQVTEYLEDTVLEGVEYCFGAGCRVEIYSGGQPRIGTSDKRTGSVRHDNHGEGGRALDAHVFLPDGTQITASQLARLAQWWLANKKGSAGLEMAGGGIHLDEWTTPPKGGALSWTYASSDAKPYAQAIRDALSAGLKGILPPKYQPRAIAPVTRPEIEDEGSLAPVLSYQDMSEAELLELIVNATADIEMASLEIRKRHEITSYIEINPTPAITQEKHKENKMTFEFLNLSSKTFWTGAVMVVAGLLQLIAPGTVMSELVVSFFGNIDGGMLITNGLAIIFGREAIAKNGKGE